MNQPRHRTAGDTGPWWARLPTLKLIVVGLLALAFQYGEDLIDLATLKVCP